MTFALAEGPANGTLTFNSDGSWSYTPDSNFHGTDSFTFTASDDTETSSPATVTLTVDAINDAPMNAVPAAQDGSEDADLVFSALNGNAVTVADGDASSLTVTLSVGQGTLTLASTAGLTFATSDGTADATLTFTAARRRSTPRSTASPLTTPSTTTAPIRSPSLPATMAGAVPGGP